MGLRPRILAAVPFFVAASAAAQSDAPVQRPEVKPGDTWTYRRQNLSERKAGFYELKVSFAGPRVILALVSPRGGREPMDTTWTPEWGDITTGQSVTYKPERELLKFPLQPGATYTSNWEVVQPKLGQFRVKMTVNARVAGWEEVSVPAGKFRALRIDASGTYQRQDVIGGGEARFQLWYVPEVQRWVKWSYKSTNFRGEPWDDVVDELVSYRLER
jgi:hypothetical protein